MGRRLSLFCSCLPRKQRDNLSSRSLYPDQDSSEPDDYSDDDNDENEYPYSSRHLHSRAQLQSLGRGLRPLNTDSPHNAGDTRPWPQSTFSNSRFSRSTIDSVDLSGRSKIYKHNTFRTPYRDDGDDSDNGGEARDSVQQTGRARFTPYRDDDDDHDMSNHSKDFDEDTGNSNDYRSGQKVLSDSIRIYSKTEDAPYKGNQEVTADAAMVITSRKARLPRNPQGKMAWDDEEDAEEVIDVDELIAEQERITRELAAQEEALRKEEEATIVRKRMAAIRAAERRGLLRFEGDQLVIPGGTDQQQQGQKQKQEQEALQQENGTWDYLSRRPLERTVSSAASSFVGGIDAFDQELKMITLDIGRNNQQGTTAMTSTSSAVRPTPTRSSTSASTATWTSAVETMQSSTPLPKTVSTSTFTSTSTSTSTGSGTSTPGQINPRGVLNNIATFLKKVDGVIAGESEDSSSDETSHQEYLQPRSPQSRPAAGGPQGLIFKDVVAKDVADNRADVTSESGRYSTRAADGQQDPTVAIHLDTEERPYPEDPFNTISTTENDGTTLLKLPASDSLVATVHTKVVEETAPSPKTVTATPVAPVETYFSTLTSFFNTGSSLMGYFGGLGTAIIATSGHHGESEGDHESRETDKDGRQLSDLKYGDPKKHQFNYQDHHLEDDDTANNSARAAAANAADDDDDDSIDDYNF
ncbi:hypothetical protein EDD11_002191 [Mortierella claussenii]|nr:hypothetical protein EDD11_002191 [Mortierella claussenii]